VYKCIPQSGDKLLSHWFDAWGAEKVAKLGTWLGREISPPGSRSNHTAGLFRLWNVASVGKESFDFIRNREAKKEAVAVAVQPKVGGEAQLRAPGKGPGEDRSGVM
jgi:hypothetical protein